MIYTISPETQVVARRPSPGEEPPFLTVAIPHYKHREYLEVVLASLFEQSFRDFEIVVSDDCSPDDSNQTIPRLLQESGLRFRYYMQPSNLGYDGNVRFCLRAAQGQYIFLLGNDDALAGPDALQGVATLLKELNMPEVALTNYEDWASGQVVRRALSTSILGAGVPAATSFFRSFSFVSGLLFKRDAAVRHETSRWDGSIYYQIYLASRILASGGRLGALDITAVRKDVQVEGRGVPNYVAKWGNSAWSFQARHTGLDSVIRVTAAAVLPSLPRRIRSSALRKIISQVLLVSYPYWLFEYRRIANWAVAIGVARSMWPWKLLAEYKLRVEDRVYLWLLYLIVTLAGLAVPGGLFQGVKSKLALAVRRVQQSSHERGGVR